MSDYANAIGLVVMVAAGWAVAGATVIGAALVLNRAIRKALDCYGGWVVFLEYRDWYNNKRAAAPQKKEG